MYRRRLVKAEAIGRPVESTVDQSGISYTVLGQTVTCTWDSLYALEEDAGTFHFWMSKSLIRGRRDCLPPRRSDKSFAKTY